jgi:hypothetical protein
MCLAAGQAKPAGLRLPAQQCDALEPGAKGAEAGSTTCQQYFVQANRHRLVDVTPGSTAFG